LMDIIVIRELNQKYSKEKKYKVTMEKFEASFPTPIVAGRIRNFYNKNQAFAFAREMRHFYKLNLYFINERVSVEYYEKGEGDSLEIWQAPIEMIADTY
jgi:hypothetical protein